MTDIVLTFALASCVIWIALAGGCSMITQPSDLLRALVKNVRNGALLGCFSFMVLFSGWYYLDVGALKPNGIAARGAAQGAAPAGLPTIGAHAVNSDPRIAGR